MGSATVAGALPGSVMLTSSQTTGGMSAATGVGVAGAATTRGMRRMRDARTNDTTVMTSLSADDGRRRLGARVLCSMMSRSALPRPSLPHHVREDEEGDVTNHQNSVYELQVTRLARLPGHGETPQHDRQQTAGERSRAIPALSGHGTRPDDADDPVRQQPETQDVPAALGLDELRLGRTERGASASAPSGRYRRWRPGSGDRSVPAQSRPRRSRGPGTTSSRPWPHRRCDIRGPGGCPGSRGRGRRQP